MTNMAPFHAMTKQNQVIHSVEISVQANKMLKVGLDPKIKYNIKFIPTTFLQEDLLFALHHLLQLFSQGSGNVIMVQTSDDNW